jgi:hypothetical protein
MTGPPDDAEAKRQRNISLVAHVGGFLLPLVGIIASIVFYVQKQQQLAWTVLATSLAGAVFWALLLNA